ncbi:MAG: hypothetical protein L0H93_05980 [Nocardioides sp.]|nr:hypothetical protein [Nocardioides sp.]
MAERLILHIGAMKSGTSFIQNVLAANREALAAQGYYFAGKNWRAQVLAVLDLTEHGADGQEPLAEDGPWNRLVKEVDAIEGTAIISMEFLGTRARRKIKLIMDSFPHTRIDVILTVRDLARTIPAMWQESVQNYAVDTWPGFVEEVRLGDREKSRAAHWFWKHQGIGNMARRWSDMFGKDHFWLITVPPSGQPSSLLWDRFVQTVGIDASDFDLSVRRNPSIGAASAFVLRALNERLKTEPLTKTAYQRTIKHGLAKRGLATRDVKEPTLGLDEPWVHERGKQEIEKLRKLDLKVVGDLADLTPQPVSGVGPDEITAEDQLGAAVDGLEQLIREQANPRRATPAERRNPTS